MVDRKPARRGSGVEIERGLRGNLQIDTARACANAPIAGGFAFCPNVAASGIGAEAAFQSTDLNTAGAAFNLYVAWRDLLDINGTTSCAGGNRASNSNSMDRSASSSRVQATFYRSNL